MQVFRNLHPEEAQRVVTGAVIYQTRRTFSHPHKKRQTLPKLNVFTFCLSGSEWRQPYTLPIHPLHQEFLQLCSAKSDWFALNVTESLSGHHPNHYCIIFFLCIMVSKAMLGQSSKLLFHLMWGEQTHSATSTCFYLWTAPDAAGGRVLLLLSKLWMDTPAVHTVSHRSPRWKVFLFVFFKSAKIHWKKCHYDVDPRFTC